MKMKKIGIIGGIGPESTIDYYRGIVKGFRERSGLDEYPKILINSINMTEMLALVANKNWNRLIALLSDAVWDLKKAGAEMAAIASNTPHAVFDRVQERVDLPLVSIVDAVCRSAQKNGYRNVLLFGTLFTMRSDFYPDGFEKMGIHTIVPEPFAQQIIQDTIFPELEEGIVLPEKKHALLELAEDLIREDNADALVLGCTEFPLMVMDHDVSVPVLNTTMIHIDAILDEGFKTN